MNLSPYLHENKHCPKVHILFAILVHADTIHGALIDINSMKLSIIVKSVELAKSLTSKEPNPELELTKYEEYTTLWLWAYPKLLGWKNDIQWLFSPVTGNSKFPGDLWGIDNKGNLIIVEVKSAKNNKLQDPFIDFVGLESRRIAYRFDCFDAKVLKKRWQKLFECEQIFLKAFLADFRKGALKTRTAPGVVPYSSKRSVVVRWPFLYINKIAKHFLAGSNYSKSVLIYLTNRLENKYASQYYFGVIGGPPNSQAGLSRKGRANYLKLSSETGKDRIYLIAISATHLKKGLVQLKAREVKPDS